jgi:hypothetical protein
MARLNFLECTLPARVFSTGLGPPSTSRNDSLSSPPPRWRSPIPRGKSIFPGCKIGPLSLLASGLGWHGGARAKSRDLSAIVIGRIRSAIQTGRGSARRSPCLEARDVEAGRFARERNNVNAPEELSIHWHDDPVSSPCQCRCHLLPRFVFLFFFSFFFTAVRVPRGMNQYERAMGMRRTRTVDVSDCDGSPRIRCQSNNMTTNCRRSRLDCLAS